MTPTDPTEAALLAAVIAAPADDGPRLLLADLLDEKGESERAEFIRVQCAVAKLEGPTDTTSDGCCPSCGSPEECFSDCRLDALRRREREILKANALPWLESWFDAGPHVGWQHGGAEGPATPEVYSCLGDHAEHDVWFTFCRGFVASVTLTAAAFMAHGPALARAAPLTRVRLADREPWQAAWVRRGAPPGRHQAYPRRLPADRPGDAGVLESALFDWLAAPHANWRQYIDRDAALDALSAAALAWARATTPCDCGDHGIPSGFTLTIKE